MCISLFLKVCVIAGVGVYRTHKSAGWALSELLQFSSMQYIDSFIFSLVELKRDRWNKIWRKTWGRRRRRRCRQWWLRLRGKEESSRSALSSPACIKCDASRSEEGKPTLQNMLRVSATFYMVSENERGCKERTNMDNEASHRFGSNRLLQLWSAHRAWNIFLRVCVVRRSTKPRRRSGIQFGAGVVKRKICNFYEINILHRRKKWERCWDEVQTCSDRCKNIRIKQKKDAKRGNQEAEGAKETSPDDDKSTMKNVWASRQVNYYDDESSPFSFFNKGDWRRGKEAYIYGRVGVLKKISSKSWIGQVLSLPFSPAALAPSLVILTSRRRAALARASLLRPSTPIGCRWSIGLYAREGLYINCTSIQSETVVKEYVEKTPSGSKLLRCTPVHGTLLNLFVLSSINSLFLCLSHMDDLRFLA